jgi:hypothetical protein
MNLLKTLWNKLVKKTSVSPTLVVVQEEEDAGDVAEIFTDLCIEAGIQKRWVARYNMASIFFEWYDGPANIENIKASIPQFKAEHPEIAPKLVRLK